MGVTLTQQRNQLVYNVLDFAHGIAPNGSNDFTTPISAAMSAASSGGTVFFPAGTYLSGNQTVLSNVNIDAAGKTAVTLKLKNAANTDLLSASTGNISLGAASGTGSSTGAKDFFIRNITLDGNKANQTAGPSYPLRFYGRGYTLENVDVKNGYTGGILCDWNATEPGTGSENASRWKDVQCFDCNSIGIEIGGPTDTHWLNIDAYHCGSHCIHVGINAGGLQAVDCHAWGPATGVTGGATGWLLETSCLLTNCESEGSDTAQVAILSSGVKLYGGRYFAGSQAGVGVQIGQTNGATAFPGQIQANTGIAPQYYSVDTYIEDITATNGGIWFANDGGRAHVQSFIRQFSSSYFTGSRAQDTFCEIYGVGLTPDGTQQLGGGIIIPIDAFSAFVVRDAASTDVCNINTHSGSRGFSFPNATLSTWYSDAYSTVKTSVNADGNGSIISKGNLSVGQSASAASIASSGTITTSGIGVARVTTSGAVTGVILQAGTVAGQICTVVNESANSITMATSATSHVADGTSDIIAATSARRYVWDSGTSLWYKCV